MACIQTENIDVSDDHILLADVMDDHNITVKRLAMEAGRGVSTVYKYCSGEATIPSVIWRVLYRLTRDGRIIKLMTGDVACMVVPVPDGRIKLDTENLQKLLKTRQMQIDCESHVLNIMADGVVSRADRKTIEQYKKDFPELIGSLFQTFQSITGAYDKL